MILIRVYHGVADHFAARIADWMLSTMMFSMGIVFLRNPDLFTTYELFFHPLSRAMSQYHWGLIAVVVGSVRLTALFINGTFPAFRWSPHVRFVMAAISAVIWVQVALGIALSGVLVLASAMVPQLALFDIFNAFLGAFEAGRVEGAIRHERHASARSV